MWSAMDTADQEIYQSLVSAADPSFEDFFRIYAESIQPREQKSRELISRMLGRPDYKVLVQKTNGVAVGISILFAPEDDAFSLLEYMAVDSGHRNSGFGRKLFLRTLPESVSRRGEPLPVLLEVDSDREASADRETRKRRQQFYKRLGCRRVEGLPYVLPMPGASSPPAMDLFVHLPVGAAAIRKSQLKHWLETIYQNVYNCQHDDPRIVEMLGPVSDPVQLGWG